MLTSDDSSLEVYGHIVAGDALGQAYVVSLWDTFVDIKREMNATSVSLVTWVDILCHAPERLEKKAKFKLIIFNKKRASASFAEEIIQRTSPRHKLFTYTNVLCGHSQYSVLPSLQKTQSRDGQYYFYSQHPQIGL